MRLPLSLRRTAVIFMYGGFAAAAFLHWRLHDTVPDPQLDDRLGMATAVAVVVFVAGTLLLATTHYFRWVGAKPKELDEREIATRNGIYRIAYLNMTWISALLLIVLVGGRFVELKSTSFGIVDVLWGYALLAFTLPAALLAWKDRAPS